jgi:transposase
MARMRSYTPEFRQAAVAMVVSQGVPTREAAARLGIPYFTLTDWVRKAGGRRAAAAAPKGPPKTLADAEARVRQLEAEVRRLTLEKEILKKAAAYFAREQP